MNLTLTNAGLIALVSAHVAAQLPPEKVEQIAEKLISDRVGMLTLEQAAKHLQCRNVRQLVDFCREHKIPVAHFGPKKRFVKISEIEAAQARHSWVPPHTTSTVIKSTKLSKSI